MRMKALILCGIFFALNIFLIPKVLALSSGGLGLLPANSGEETADSSQTFSYTIGPGGRVYDEVEISNTTNEQIEVLLYSTDPVLNNDGQLSCGQYVEEKTAEGKWIQVDGERYILNPQQRKNVKFVITVPDKADVGEHNACIVLQKKLNQVPSSQQGISLRMRIALRVKMNIPGDVQRTVEIIELKHEIQENKSVLLTTLENRGNVSIGGTFQLSSKLFGLIETQNVTEEITILRDAKLGKISSKEKPFYGGLYIGFAQFSYNNESQIQQAKSMATWYWIWPELWFILLVASIGAGIFFFAKKRRSLNLNISKVKKQIKT